MHAQKRTKPFHEPSNEHAAPTELENDQGAVRNYRHGAPTGALQTVHGSNARSQNVEAFHEPYVAGGIGLGLWV
jgi:hypothetical protein